jgi:hypothetical protein
LGAILSHWKLRFTGVLIATSIGHAAQAQLDKEQLDAVELFSALIAYAKPCGYQLSQAGLDRLYKEARLTTAEAKKLVEEGVRDKERQSFNRDICPHLEIGAEVNHVLVGKGPLQKSDEAPKAHSK